MKLNYLLIVLICTGAVSCSLGSSSVAPEAADFAFTGIGYEKNPVIYSDPAGGNTYYIDPVYGSADGDGSEAAPWKTLQQVIEDGLIETWNRPAGDPERESTATNAGAPVKAGDVLILREGNHGTILVRSSFNDKFITIRAASGERPLIRSIRFISAGMWRIDGLHISQERNMDEFVRDTSIMIESYWGQSREIEIYNNTVYSVWDTSGWSMEDWNTFSCNGISIDADYCIVKNNYFRNVNFGISVGGEHNDIINNTVKNFAGDGMRGNGNYLLFEKNFVKNCYAVNANHDDGFQSFCVNEITEWQYVTLRKNVILNYEDADQPFRGTLQGIGCFDGFFRHWTVENNLVVVDHWHGITFMGMTDSVISNNIVVDINTEEPGPTWIAVTPHKDERPSENCKVNNNITHSVTTDNSSINVTESDNTIIAINQRKFFFTDPDNLDFTLKPEYASMLE